VNASVVARTDVTGANHSFGLKIVKRSESEMESGPRTDPMNLDRKSQGAQ
jgi:hypothetical protein